MKLRRTLIVIASALAGSAQAMIVRDSERVQVFGMLSMSRSAAAAVRYGATAIALGAGAAVTVAAADESCAKWLVTQGLVAGAAIALAGARLSVPVNSTRLSERLVDVGIGAAVGALYAAAIVNYKECDPKFFALVILSPPPECPQQSG